MKPVRNAIRVANAILTATAVTDLRVGQAIVNAIATEAGSDKLESTFLFYIEDDKLAELLEKYTQRMWNNG
jgi:hypothetical protein